MGRQEDAAYAALAAAMRAHLQRLDGTLQAALGAFRVAAAQLGEASGADRAPAEVALVGLYLPEPPSDGPWTGSPAPAADEFTGLYLPGS